MVKSFQSRTILLLGVFSFIAATSIAEEPLSLSVETGGGQVVLSWPAWATDAVLEQVTNAQPSVFWTSIAAELYQSDATGFHYRFSPAGATGLYRLRRVPSPVPGLSGHWQLDENGGGLAVAAGNSGLPLHMTNTSWAAGRFAGSSLQFNGLGLGSGGSLAWLTNDSHRVLPSPEDPFSISFWFRPDALRSGSEKLFALVDEGGSVGWGIELNNPGPGTNYFTLVAGGNAIDGRTLLLPAQWHQLTMTHEGNEARLYLDSRLIAQGAVGLLNTTGSLFFGGAPGAMAGFLGRIDEIRTYSVSLNHEQISQTGQWRFDENARALAADSSIQGRPALVVPTNGWSAGKSGSGIDLNAGSVAIPNEYYSLLPASGGEFSVSLWVRPHALPTGRSGVLSCAAGTNAGWQLILNAQDPNQTWLEFTSTNLGGTLALLAPLALTNESWTKLDLAYSGGIASIYVNGTRAASESGAIRAAREPLLLGGAAGTPNFNGSVDELKIYCRERPAAEIGPVALPMWETALVNSSTNLLLQGSGPPGKPLTYKLLTSAGPVRGTTSHSSGSELVTYNASGQKGPDSFAYTVSDGEFTSPPATVTISVVEPHWLSPSGGTVPPLDGTSPERAWPAWPAAALDAIWQTNNYYDCFFYAPGEYHTTGWKFLERSTAHPGCKHFGSASEGPSASTIKLVDTWSSWGEGIIFAHPHYLPVCDGFEVRNLVLDCNAQNNPKFVVGEPVWISIPLTATGRVEEVGLHWAGPYRFGAPAEFAVGTRSVSQNGFLTNMLAVASTGRVDIVSIEAESDELLVRLDRRGPGVDFYGVAEIELAGATVSLPTALVPGAGESLLDPEHSVLFAIDGDSKSSWASGAESQVQISLPLAPGTALNQLKFEWNCETLPDQRRLGRAASYIIFARDPNSGGIVNVPFVSHGRDADGDELVTFGTLESTNTVFTDEIVLMLTERETGVHYYSLKEVSLRNGSSRVALRVPAAVNALSPSLSILRAFDKQTNTFWASGTQGSLTAVDMHGNNLKFTGLKVVGFGTKAGRECFPLVVLALDSGVVSNVLIEDCVFTQPAANNSDGLSTVAIVGQGPDSLRNAVVRRCTVRGVRSQFTYSHGITAPLVENCLVEDCEVGVYFEPDPKGWADDIGGIVIRSNQFLNVAFGITMDFHPRGRFDSLAVLGNEIVLQPAGRVGFGVRICDVCAVGPGASTTNLTILNNIIRYPGWAPRNTVDGGLIYGDIQHAVYGNNIIALGTPHCLRVRPYPAGSIPDVPPPEDCDNPGYLAPGPSTYPPSMDVLPPGYRRAWYNNRDLSGTLLPVRHSEWGVDRFATQQQWSE